MCYQPIEIRNNAKSGHKNIKLTKIVPCGMCEECYANYQKEWFLRAYYQYKETTEVYKGKVAFVTLTYNKKCLPWYHDIKENFHCKCFNKHDIQIFVKYLRRYAVNYLNTPIDVATELKTIFCSEFGPSPYGEHMPHYHGLVYLPFQISEFRLKKMLKFAWSRCKKEDKGKRFTEQRHYPLGFVSFSKGKGAFVTSPSALMYSMKYTSKDLNGYNDWYGLVDYINKSESNYEAIKDYLPFHLQSRGFGKYGVQFITDEDIYNGYVMHPCPPEDHPDIKFTLPIPQYYLRHINYTKPEIENNYKIGLLQHSERFYKTLEPQLKAVINRTAESLERTISSYEEFKTRFSHCVNSTIDTLKFVDTFNILHSILNGRVRDYSLYKAINKYSSAGVKEQDDMFYTLHEFVKNTAKFHDHMVNTYDMSEQDFDIAEEIVPYERLQIIPQINPLMSYEEIEDEPFFVLEPHEDIYANRTLYLNIPIQETHFKTERRMIPKFSPTGKPIIHSKRGSYLETHKKEADIIKYSRPWSSFPIFKDFDVADDLLNLLNCKNKSHHLVNKATKRRDEKYVKDYYNTSLYST